MISREFKTGTVILVAALILYYGTSFLKGDDFFKKGIEVHSAMADYDNDGHLDILILKEKGVALFRNENEAKFDEVTDDAFSNPETTQGLNTLFLDIDHEGDLDLIIGGQNNKLFSQ